MPRTVHTSSSSTNASPAAHDHLIAGFWLTLADPGPPPATRPPRSFQRKNNDLLGLCR